MIGPLTLFGWLAVFGVVAVVVGMAWLGWLGRWRTALLGTLPFIGMLIWVELTTAGPPMWEDPYGLMMAVIVLGPAVLGWVAFLLLRVGAHLRRHHR